MTSIRALLADNIKKRRLFLGLSQAKLAEKVSTSTHYISQIEQQNKFPSPEMLERIAEALEFDSPQLFATKMNYDEAIKQFKESFLSDIGTAVSAAVEEKLAELKNENNPETPEPDTPSP